MMSRLFGRCLFVLGFIAVGDALAAVPTAILVDKKKNELFVTEYKDGAYQTVKKFHATTGRVKGDKEDEGDLKTPEGIYTFSSRLTPPHIKPKFGELAFYINYPNDYDKIAGRTGFDIMLHATDAPERLKKDFDSEGCVVVDNHEIREIGSYIKLGLTPILIFQELTPDYMNPGKDQKLVKFFRSWVDSWKTKNIEKYIEHYHTEFSANGMNKPRWKDYKTQLTRKYDRIEVTTRDEIYYRHPKYSMITFTQDYKSFDKKGRPLFRSEGTKILYIAEESGEPKVITESFNRLRW